MVGRGLFSSLQHASTNFCARSGVSETHIFNESRMKPKNTIRCVGMRTDLSGCTTKQSLSKKPRVAMMFAMQVSYSPDFSQESSMNMTDVCPYFLKYARAGFNNLVNFRGHIASPLGKHTNLYNFPFH